jgi:uncharacterized membrane protein
MEAGRYLRHLFTLPGSAARAFPDPVLSTISNMIRESEKAHGGEIRFAVEAALDPLPLLRGQSARDRALEVFSDLRVWDTESNNGVLLYILLADRDVEIVADRGFNGKVDAAQWEQACRAMEGELVAGRYEAAALRGIGEIGALVARHFPPAGADRNELPDRPAVV